MANIQLRLNLLTGTASTPLYDAYYSTNNGSTYIIVPGGSNLQMPTIGSGVSITVPDNTTNVKLISLSVGCNSTSYNLPVVTTTTTTTLIPISATGTYTCATKGSSNGTFTINSVSGGSGAPYQTAFFARFDVNGEMTPVWNNYPQVSSYGNLRALNSPTEYVLGIKASNGAIIFQSSTLCTTTTNVPANVTITTLNGLDPNSFTVYVNDVADTGWKSGTRNVGANSVIKIIYNSNACGVTKNGSAYASNTNVTLVANDNVTFSLNNYNYWTETGNYPCYDNIMYIQRVNPCGVYDTIKRYYGTTCDCQCNETCNGTSYTNNECRGQDLVRYEYWNCTGNRTGNYQVVESCSCSCNYTECGQTYYTPNYCGQPGRVGTNPSSLYRDKYYACGNTYITTETISNCSCSCDQTCLGEYWGDPYCDGTGIQKRNRKYTCNNANTGQVETISTCSETCGAFVAPIWTPVGDPTCQACYQVQEEVQSNPCCVDPPQGDTRTVGLGLSSECGTWTEETYCVGYDLWSRQRNSCTNTTCCDTLVEANSYFCGYRPCSTWDIYAYNSDEYVYVNYQNCADFPDFASFYSGSGGNVGSLCVRNGTTPTITSGNGQANNTYVMCS
jgi:hypothetical protein